MHTSSVRAREHVGDGQGITPAAARFAAGSAYIVYYYARSIAGNSALHTWEP